MGALETLNPSSSRRLHLARSASQSSRKFAASLSVTLIGQAVTLASLFLITRFSVHLFGPAGFGEYQVARRTLAVVALPMMCGLGISLPRYIARDIADSQRVGSWLVSALCLSILLIGGFVAVGTVFSSVIGRWTFGDAGRQSLVISLLLASAGTFASTLAIAALRGLSQFKETSILQVVSAAAIPFVGILVAHRSVERALAISGIGWLAMSFIVFVVLWRKWVQKPLQMSAIRSEASTLWIFGLPRVPGEIALFGFFALPGYASVHRGDIIGAGILSVGLALIQAIAVAFASTGFVLLPHWSRATATREGLRSARKHIAWLVVASAALAFIGTALMEACLRPIAAFLLGPMADQSLHDIRYVLLGTIPYVIYLVLRDYFDAISVFPLNSVSLGIAIVIQAILLSFRTLSIALATLFGFLVLGIIMLTIWIASPYCISETSTA